MHSCTCILSQANSTNNNSRNNCRPASQHIYPQHLVGKNIGPTRNTCMQEPLRISSCFPCVPYRGFLTLDAKCRICLISGASGCCGVPATPLDRHPAGLSPAWRSRLASEPAGSAPARHSCYYWLLFKGCFCHPHSGAHRCFFLIKPGPHTVLPKGS